MNSVGSTLSPSLKTGHPVSDLSPGELLGTSAGDLFGTSVGDLLGTSVGVLLGTSVGDLLRVCQGDFFGTSPGKAALSDPTASPPGGRLAGTWKNRS